MDPKRHLRLAKAFTLENSKEFKKLAEIHLDGKLINKQQLIDYLNEDIALEYSAAIQYIQHASMLKGVGFESMQEEMLVHADEEIAHAKKLTDRIAYMGGVPTTKVSQILTSPDNFSMMKQDLNAERNAIARYSERIAQAIVLQDYGLVAILQKILTEEEEHENDLLNGLGEGAEDPGNDHESAADMLDPQEIDRYEPVTDEVGPSVRLAADRKARLIKLQELKDKQS